jgi:hypothetical protein
MCTNWRNRNKSHILYCFSFLLQVLYVKYTVIITNCTYILIKGTYTFWLIDGFLVFNATFTNISAISRRPVLVVEGAGVPGENHRSWTSIWSTLSLADASRVHPFCNLQSQAQTHSALVICLVCIHCQMAINCVDIIWYLRRT